MRIALAAAAAFLILVFICPQASAQDAPDAVVLSVAVSDLPPWRIVDHGEVTGIEPDVLREAAARMGVGLEFKAGSDKQCLDRVRKGQADLMGGLEMPEAGDSRLVFAMPPYATGTTSVFYALRSRAAGIVGYEYLRALRVAVGRGEKHFPQFDLDSQQRKTRTSGPADGFARLVAGEVQAVVAEELRADWWLAAHPRTAGRVAKTPLAYRGEQALYFAFSAKSPHAALAPALGEALASMIRDGSLARIVARYDAGR